MVYTRAVIKPQSARYFRWGFRKEPKKLKSRQIEIHQCAPALKAPISVLIIRSSHLQPASTRARQLSRPKKLSCMSKQPQSLTHPRRSLRSDKSSKVVPKSAWRLLNIARHLNLAMFCGRSGLNCSRQRLLVKGTTGQYDSLGMKASLRGK